MSLTLLAVKGLSIAVKYIVTHGATSAVGHAAAIGGKVLVTQGVGALLAETATVCIIIGGVKWSLDLVNVLKNVVDDISAGNVVPAIEGIAKLLIKTNNLDIDIFTDNLHDICNSYNIAEEKVDSVKEFIHNYKNEILQEAKKLKK